MHAQFEITPVHTKLYFALVNEPAHDDAVSLSDNSFHTLRHIFAYY